MNLKEKTFNGAKWSALSSITTIGIGLLQLTLLARLLEPKEFGLLTIAMVILILVDTFSDFGLSNSIIQRKNISETELSTLYWINVVIGVGVFAILFFGSHFFSQLLHQPDLEIIIETLSVAFIIMPQGQQFRALLQKELEFTQISIAEITGALVGFVVTLACAWFKPVAICAIWGFLAAVSVRMLMFCWFGREIYQPKAVFQLDGVKSNLRYGGFLTADNLFNQLSMNIPTMILSRVLGAVITGGYNLAFNIAVMPPAKINPIITRVLFPAFARIQDDQPRLRHNFYKMLSIVGLLNFAALLGLMSVADNFVLFMFGEKWLFIAPVMQILCVVGLLRAISNPIGALVMATALVNVSSKLNALRLVITVPAIWLGVVSGGVIGAALAFLAIQILYFALNYFFLIRPILGKSGKAYLYSLWMPFKLSLPTYAISYLSGFAFDQVVSVNAVLALQVVSGAAVYIVMVLVSKEPVIVETRAMLFRKLKINPDLNKGKQAV
ncbi:lipopolysaccharide exporter [Erwinia toletana]|uniref:Lipopolysaccharide exporter n=1 Tax=Winslowiella toletana TaxID=92490 RepID=A0ABS4P900_9GAMM|nr:MOP flippase family protein [Winslowiella toletana]MBP2169080.1 lipopolysaccharide exporter [Winslowiella toletana]